MAKNTTRKFDTVSGREEMFYHNGNPLSVKYIKDGKLEGSLVCWFDNGNKWIECEYKNNKLHGTHKEWYRNGSIKNLFNYNNGELDGVQLSWYDNAGTKTIRECKNGCSVGLFKYYHPNGNLKKLNEFDIFGVETIKTFLPDGILLRIEKRDTYGKTFSSFVNLSNGLVEQINTPNKSRFAK